MRVARRSLGVAALGLTAACSTTTEANPQPVERLRILANPAVTDTIEATPLQSVVVELRDNTGGPIQGAVVRFSAQLTTPPQGAPTMLVSTEAGITWDLSVSDTTDARGRAAARVRLGSIAGPGGVDFVAVGSDLAGSLSFTIAAGNAAELRLSRGDTAVVAGTLVEVAGHVFDRAGNPRPEIPTFSARSEPADAGSITPSGSVTAAGPFGNVHVSARAGTLVDSLTVGIFPHGTLVGRDDIHSSLVTIDTDGSNRRVLSPPGAFIPTDVEPAWSPDGREVAFGSELTILIASLTGEIRSLFVTPQPNILTARWPAYSPDGRWIYYSGQAIDGSGTSLYRIRPDGTAPSRLTDSVSATRPSPSPDGRSIAFQGGDATVRVLDLTLGALTSVRVPGIFPEWSPRGNRIAYYDYYGSAFRSMRADGSDIRTIRVAGSSHPMTWSPDGDLLLVQSYFVFRLVQPETGISVPIPATAGLSNLAWKPTP